jgi:DNA-binding NarL/FixJ family response regulator
MPILKSHPMPRPIRVMIVEDHPLFRAGLEHTLGLEEHMEITGFCSDGNEVVQAVEKQKPHVILMDVNLPNVNGLQITRSLQSQYSDIAVIILTAHHDEEQTIHAIRSGASAYYPKHLDPDKLIKIIEHVARGYYVVENKTMTGEQVNTWLKTKIEANTPNINDTEGYLMPLSPREMEILFHVTNGMLNKEIAADLGISQQTVKNHMTSILRKLNVKDRTQAAVIALRRGWVRIDSNRDNNRDNNHEANHETNKDSNNHSQNT